VAVLPATPTFKAAGTSQNGTGALTVAWPAGHAVDDIAILVVSNKNQAIALSTAAGFVGIRATSTTSTGISVYWCRATSTSMASPVVAASTNGAYARIYTFSNCVRSGNPFNNSNAGTNASSTSISIAALTNIPVQRCLAVGIVGYNFASATPQTSTWAGASLTGVTNRGDESTASNCGAALTTGTITGTSTGTITATLANSCPHSCEMITLLPRLDGRSGIRHRLPVGQHRVG
jgi:hypothetical protein